MYIDFDCILPIAVQYLKILKLMLMLIFSVIVATLILQSKKTIAHGLMKKLGDHAIFFPDAKQVKKYGTIIVCKNVHMFKMIKIKLMRVLISPEIINTPFLYYYFYETL